MSHIRRQFGSQYQVPIPRVVFSGTKVEKIYTNSSQFHSAPASQTLLEDPIMNFRLRFTCVCTCVILMASLITGCSNQQTRSTSNVVDYLYPKDTAKVEPGIPNLQLPLKVGIAFVPTQSPNHYGTNTWTGKSDIATLTESKKDELLNRVADRFREEKFVSDIQVIPSNYLTPQGSFANLSQIKTMYDIDVIALVSFDQIQFTDSDFLSISYWTLVGAYAVSGEKNDTNTLLDTTIYDIDSKKMLFRAPGTSHVKGRSTPVNLSEELRADSITGYDLATENMIKNLEQQLNQFREKIKQNPDLVKIRR
jgi:rhombotail lipoprotein